MNRKIYVLDTNILIHDPMSIYSFEENDVLILLTVLEELDDFKNKKEEARQAIKEIENIFKRNNSAVLTGNGIPIVTEEGKNKGGYLYILNNYDEHFVSLGETIENKLIDNKSDNLIINALLIHKKELIIRESSVINGWNPSKLILVTKDICMRIKAKSLGIESEDYKNDLYDKKHLNGEKKSLIDVENIGHGYVEVDEDKFNEFKRHIFKKDTVYNISKWSKYFEVECYNGLYIVKGKCTYKIVHKNKENVLIKEIKNDISAFGIKGKSMEQNIALDGLLDEEKSLVFISGQAGSGKTLLALAAGISQLNQDIYKKIIVTRSTPPLSEELGFLPGNEEEKMKPWLGAFYDNFEILLKHNIENDLQNTNCVKNKQKTNNKVNRRHFTLNDLTRSGYFEFKSINFMRGRSFQETYLIIDECQNLTFHQLKTLLSRAGIGTKVICLGNLSQIDTLQLDYKTSGMTQITSRMKFFNKYIYIHLNDSPRSELSNYVENNL